MSYSPCASPTQCTPPLREVRNEIAGIGLIALLLIGLSSGLTATRREASSGTRAPAPVPFEAPYTRPASSRGRDF